LNLQDNQLVSLPAEIGHLRSLRELNLGGNQLTTMPAEIGQLPSLKKLYLLRKVSCPASNKLSARSIRASRR